jgi:hypothetical protein
MTLGKIMSFAAALTLAVALSGAASAGQFKNRTALRHRSGWGN